MRDFLAVLIRMQHHFECRYWYAAFSSEGAFAIGTQRSEGVTGVRRYLPLALRPLQTGSVGQVLRPSQGDSVSWSQSAITSWDLLSSVAPCTSRLVCNGCACKRQGEPRILPTELRTNSPRSLCGAVVLLCWRVGRCHGSTGGWVPTSSNRRGIGWVSGFGATPTARSREA